MALALILVSGGPSVSRAADLTMVCGRDHSEYLLCREATEAWSKHSGHRVRVIEGSADVNRRLQIYRELLATGYPKLDVLEIDIIWPGVLADELIDLKPYFEDLQSDFHPSLIANNTVHGRLVAIPWFLDFGLLYYRKDLLTAANIPTPQDWDQLQEAALRLQEMQRQASNERFWGFLWQGGRSEALVCNVLGWLASWSAGRIVEQNGKVSIGNENAALVFERAKDWLAVISPESVLSFTEAESLALFTSGNAAFLRHWPGAWAQLNEAQSGLLGKVGIAPLPRGVNNDVHPATLGGWQLAVSCHSQQPRLAAELVGYLTGVQEQRRRALESGLLPTRTAVYQDEDFHDAVPVSRLLANDRITLVTRPSNITAGRYPEVTLAIQKWSYELLSGVHEDYDEFLQGLLQELNQLCQPGGAW
jgi:trehalose/maltose transport system substrate-binding protein